MIKKCFTCIVIALIIGYLVFDCYVGTLTGDRFILKGERALLDKQYTQAINYLDQAYREIVRSNQSALFSKGLTMDKMSNFKNALALTYSETGQFAKAETLLTGILTQVDVLNAAFRQELERQLEAIKNKQPWSDVQSN
jgi:hypothetical protein